MTGNFFDYVYDRLKAGTASLSVYRDPLYLENYRAAFGHLMTEEELLFATLRRMPNFQKRADDEGCGAILAAIVYGDVA